MKEEILIQGGKTSDTIIHVNRTIRPDFPGWVRNPVRPELDLFGPTEYDVATMVELWLHDKQKDEMVPGRIICEQLDLKDILKRSLGLHDALEIQKKGIAVFQRLFGNDAIFFWKSIVVSYATDYFVPCLYDNHGNVDFGWCRILNNFGPKCRAILFKKV